MDKMTTIWGPERNARRSSICATGLSAMGFDKNYIKRKEDDKEKFDVHHFM